MPWEPFSRMKDMDLGNIHNYLSGLEPVYRENALTQKGNP